MPRVLVLVLLTLFGCSHVPANRQTAPVDLMRFSGIVERVCLECAEALLLSPNGGPGGGLVWDVLTVRIASPESFLGKVVSVEVLVESPEQSKRYPQNGAISFPAAVGAIEELRVMLHVEDLAAN